MRRLTKKGVVLKTHCLFFISMRYHFEKPNRFANLYGRTYRCEHPVYDRCTLYLIGSKGLAVIQQRFDPIKKTTRWGEIDPWITDAIYLNERFKALFDERSAVRCDGLYPTVTVRQLMWALKMKPLPKERWETVFDRKNI